jgi:hypothetical protein
MDLKSGSRWKSITCTTEIMVVRPPRAPLQLECGGHKMRPAADPALPAISPAPDRAGGTPLGKRYEDAASGIEVLVIKPGAGLLAVNGQPLTQKRAKALPASD